jgi:MbtH protein
MDAEQRYRVVVNDEGQYSILAVSRQLPPGWQAEGTEGSRPECLEHIEQVWIDLTPRSLRPGARR